VGRKNLREGLSGSWFFDGFEKDQLDALLRLGQEVVWPERMSSPKETRQKLFIFFWLG
jgi:hypothetical protein